MKTTSWLASLIGSNYWFMKGEHQFYECVVGDTAGGSRRGVFMSKGSVIAKIPGSKATNKSK
jgi:hypothetical protein